MFCESIDLHYRDDELITQLVGTVVELRVTVDCRKRDEVIKVKKRYLEDWKVVNNRKKKNNKKKIILKLLKKHI